MSDDVVEPETDTPGNADCSAVPPLNEVLSPATVKLPPDWLLDPLPVLRVSEASRIVAPEGIWLEPEPTMESKRTKYCASPLVPSFMSMVPVVPFAVAFPVLIVRSLPPV